MSFCKKIVFTIIFLFFSVQPAFAMKKMGKFFKNIKTKKFNFFNTYKFMPKMNSASLWQKGGLATVMGTIGYGIWNSNLHSAILEDKQYEQHDDKTREERIEEYVKNYAEYLTIDCYKQASETEKQIMLASIAVCLEKGICTKEIVRLVTFITPVEGSLLTQEDQVALTLAAIQGMGRATKVDGFDDVLFCNYKKLTTEQRYKVIDAVVAVLQQGKKFWPLEYIYGISTPEEREKWCEHLIEASDDGIWALYEASTPTERDKFLNFFVKNLEQGDSLGLLKSFGISWIYKVSTTEEQNKLFSGMMAALKSDYMCTDRGCIKAIDTSVLRLDGIKSALNSAIYSSLRPEHKDEVLDYIIDVSITKSDKQAVKINKTLEMMYYCMPHEGKIKLAQQLINASFSGKNIDFGCFFSYVKEDEKSEIVDYFFDKIKESNGVNFRKHQWLNNASKSLNYKQLKKMQSDAIALIKQYGDKVTGLSFLGDKIFFGISDNNFCRDVVSLIQEGHVLHKDDVNWLYKYWSEYDRSECAKMRSALVKKVEQGNAKYLRYFNENDLMFDDLSEDQKETIKKSISRYFNWNLLKGTQTGGHLQQNFQKVFTRYLQYLEESNNQEIINVLERAIHSERDLIDKKYIVFYHAQMWNISFKLLLYDLIMRAKYQSLDQYLDTRFTEDSTCEENARRIFDSKELHKRLLKGRAYGQSLVFTNMALAGNSTLFGSSTLGYLVQNSNIAEFTIDNCAIFAYFGFEEFCKQNKDKIDAIEKEFKKLSKHGNLLQIAVPDNVVEKYVYAARSGGYPDEYHLKSRLPRSVAYVLGLGTTNNIRKIAKLLKTSPEKFEDSDQMEFVFPMTPYGMAKGRRDGIEIKSFNTADPEKLQNIVNQLQDILQPLAEEWKAKKQLDPFACYKKHKKKFRNF